MKTPYDDQITQLAADRDNFRSRMNEAARQLRALKKRRTRFLASGKTFDATTGATDADLDALNEELAELYDENGLYIG